jgi:hypothetical protein
LLSGTSFFGSGSTNPFFCVIVNGLSSRRERQTDTPVPSVILTGDLLSLDFTRVIPRSLAACEPSASSVCAWADLPLGRCKLLMTRATPMAPAAMQTAITHMGTCLVRLAAATGSPMATRTRRVPVGPAAFRSSQEVSDTGPNATLTQAAATVQMRDRAVDIVRWYFARDRTGSLCKVRVTEPEAAGDHVVNRSIPDTSRLTRHWMPALPPP